jgi:hypothetical protein
VQKASRSNLLKMLPFEIDQAGFLLVVLSYQVIGNKYLISIALQSY